MVLKPVLKVCASVYLLYFVLVSNDLYINVMLICLGYLTSFCDLGSKHLLLKNTTLCEYIDEYVHTESFARYLLL